MPRRDDSGDDGRHVHRELAGAQRVQHDSGSFPAPRRSPGRCARPRRPGRSGSRESLLETLACLLGQLPLAKPFSMCSQSGWLPARCAASLRNTSSQPFKAPLPAPAVPACAGGSGRASDLLSKPLISRYGVRSTQSALLTAACRRRAIPAIPAAGPAPRRSGGTSRCRQIFAAIAAVEFAAGLVHERRQFCRAAMSLLGHARAGDRARPPGSSSTHATFFVRRRACGGVAEDGDLVEQRNAIAAPAGPGRQSARRQIAGSPGSRPRRPAACCSTSFWKCATNAGASALAHLRQAGDDRLARLQQQLAETASAPRRCSARRRRRRR